MDVRRTKSLTSIEFPVDNQDIPLGGAPPTLISELELVKRGVLREVTLLRSIATRLEALVSEHPVEEKKEEEPNEEDTVNEQEPDEQDEDSSEEDEGDEKKD